MGARPPPPVGLSRGPRPAANRVPPGPGPSPLALPTTPVWLVWAAPAGPDRHCRKMRGAAPSAPRSRPSAATPIGGLRPGSLRVHAPCKETTHGSRLGFPGRRPPRGPAALGDVARSLQVLPGRKPREERIREERDGGLAERWILRDKVSGLDGSMPDWPGSSSSAIPLSIHGECPSTARSRSYIS